MSWKTMRTAAVAVGTAALLAVWLLWLRVTPGLLPDDVTLRGQLLPTAGLAGAQAASGEAWAAQLQVKLGKEDAANDVVYMYIPGYQGTKYDIVEDNRPGAIGMIPVDTIRTQVRTMLQQTGLSVSETELNEPGVSYKGTKPSYTVRVYLRPQSNGGAATAATPSKAAPAASASDTSAAASAVASPAAPDVPAYAVYIHRERRFGKNVGWTKAVKLEPQQ
jgi:hypothetical protein